MKRSSAPTLQDVANEAGVTAMTVSVVLNGSRSATRVSDATRQRIQEVAERLQYRPNAVARGLSRRRMDAIGVVAVIDIGDVNLYFLELLNGVLEECTLRGQNTTIFSVMDWSNEEKLLSFCDGRVDGIIFVSPVMSPEFGAALQKRTPFVTIHSDSLFPNAINLDVDNEGGSHDMVRYVISMGHRRIMHISGGTQYQGSLLRIAGYKRALAEANIPVDESLILHSQFTEDAGRQTLKDAIEARTFDLFPTAIFCANDAIAIGCMDVLSSYGLKMPEDVSVVGFDDTLISRITVPKLTTVRQPFRELGRLATAYLLEHTAGKAKTEEGGKALATEPSGSVLLPHTLTIRDSVALPRRTLIHVP
jgi:LacI family transcriptional regulator